MTDPIAPDWAKFIRSLEYYANQATDSAIPSAAYAIWSVRLAIREAMALPVDAAHDPAPAAPSGKTRGREVAEKIAHAAGRFDTDAARNSFREVVASVIDSEISRAKAEHKSLLDCIRVTLGIDESKDIPGAILRIARKEETEYKLQIAEVVAAERERCAKIAAVFAEALTGDCGYTAAEISRHIREETKPPAPPEPDLTAAGCPLEHIEGAKED